MSVAMGRGWSRRHVLLLVSMLAAVVWWGWSALEDIAMFAVGQEDNGYIILAPLVAAYLTWLRRSRLQFIRYRPNLVGPAIVAVGLFASNWGDANGIQLFWHAGVLVAMFGCVYSMTGWEILRQFGPAVIATMLVIPVPGRVRESLAGPAQEFSVVTAHAVLQLLGFETTRAGSVITIAGEPVAVGEACNGMRMVFALGLVVFAFVFSVPFSTSTRLVLIAMAPIVALLCNIVRLVPTSIAYGWLDPVVAEQVHDVGGWLMLPLALLMLIGIVRLMKWLDLPVMNWRLVPA
ncbi:MAG: exosortase/archaeosortase family protein [Phycisphaerales bacterium]|jgi:exosortase